MPQAYSDPTRENDPYALPDIEVFEMIAQEVVAFNEDLILEYMKRPEFRLASMNHRTRIAMIDTIIKEEGIIGGWFWWSCFPGCLPDGPPNGPFKNYNEALADARSE
jgi:hypothetical protein